MLKTTMLRQPGRTAEDKYTLDWGSTDAERKKHLLKQTKGPLGYLQESTYNGNGTKYAYVQDLQGDICQIVDASGNVVVEYTYDAWGKVLSTTGSMAGTLGTIQPFRYRGYV